MSHSPWHAHIITLMPEMYPGPLGASLVGDARARGAWDYTLIDLRQFGQGPHRKVDDSPYGGGAGMVIKPDVVDAAIQTAYSLPPCGRGLGWGGVEINAPLPSPPHPPHPQAGGSPPSPARGEGITPQLIHFSPRGERLSQPLLRELAAVPSLILLCGRYEAIDERVLEKYAPREVSLGDFVLTGGDIPAMALIDGCVRLLPGVIGKEASLGEESFGDGAYAQLLEYPHYTKPAQWEGRAVPEVLMSGHHANIETWRRAQAEAITRARRPDLVKGGK